MHRFSLALAATVLFSIVGCSYMNGKGDAEKFARDFIAANFADAAATSYQCQSRDTDGNAYISCSVTIQWKADDPRREIVPLECAVNRTGNGCNNEGCRPLATFGRPGMAR